MDVELIGLGLAILIVGGVALMWLIAFGGTPAGAEPAAQTPSHKEQ